MENITKTYAVADTDSISDSPYYALAHEAVQEALDEFTPGITCNTVLTRKTMQDAKAAGMTAETTIHQMREQTLDQVFRFVLPNVAFTSERNENDDFVLTGSTVCLSEEQFADMLTKLETRVVKAIEAAVDTAVAAQQAKLAS